LLCHFRFVLPAFSRYKGSKLTECIVDDFTSYFAIMQVDVLIIGQGLCGSWLSYYLEKAGISFLVIDDAKPQTPSKIASGIINPVTGRRLVKTWLIDEVMPFAISAYRQMENALATPLIRQCPVVDFFSAPDVEVAFKKRVEEKADYLKLLDDTTQWQQNFQFPFGAGMIEDCWLIDTASFIEKWRIYLQHKGLLQQEAFDENELLVTDDGIQYKDVQANKIIYCNGTAAFESRYFNRLPFAPNKGEALIVSIFDLPADFIYKKGMSLVPWKPGQWWVGSSYQWSFDNEIPTEDFRKTAENWLKNFCKLPFEILEHLAAVRPATVERRPFVGFHPVQAAVGILNGMGTKGVSLAPFFAEQLAGAIATGEKVLPDADVMRFAKVLSR
jgi:glycine/D-amino acid oxidase-like deaminating enzyme